MERKYLTSSQIEDYLYDAKKAMGTLESAKKNILNAIQGLECDDETISDVRNFFEKNTGSIFDISKKIVKSAKIKPGVLVTLNLGNIAENGMSDTEDQEKEMDFIVAHEYKRYVVSEVLENGQYKLDCEELKNTSFYRDELILA